MTDEKKRKPALHTAAVTLGAKGGEKGGPARAKALTGPEKSAIAKQGAKARWKGQG